MGSLNTCAMADRLAEVYLNTPFITALVGLPHTFRNAYKA